MKLRYLRVVRRAQRYLKHPTIKSNPLLSSMARPLFKRDLWHPCRNTAATALSIGLFCAMLPIPFQMFVAALLCVWVKANIPIAMSTCWVTNPFTQVPIWLTQEKFGDWIRSKIDLKVFHFLNIERDFFNVTLNVASFTVGFFAMAIILSLLAYPIVYGISAFLPNRGRNIRPPQKKTRKVDF